MKSFLLSIALVAISLQAAAQSNALHFDGIDDHVTTPFIGPGGDSARTVEAWIRTTANADPNNGGIQKVILDWGNMATGARFTFNLLFSNGLRIEVQGSGLSSTTPLNDGLWHHVAAVYDPTLATNRFKLYVDGVLDTAANLPTPVFTSSFNTMRIGRRLDNIHYFQGDIDEVRCWNVALSATDIQNSYNREFCSPPVGLVAYYKFNSGLAGGSNFQETTAFEEVSGNHGSLENFALFGTTSNWVSGAVSSPLTTTDTIQITACKSYTSLGGAVLNASATITDTLLNASGCDSIVVQEVDITQVDTTVQVNQFTLIAQSSAATTFQWLDCDSGFAIIPGAVSDTFQPVRDGNYAVLITEGNCSDTSACFAISGISVNRFSPTLTWELYPNPTQGIIDIKTNILLNDAAWWITDLQGKRVANGNWPNASVMRIDISNLKSGQYVFSVQSTTYEPTHIRLVKQ